ncbi:luciferase family protein [Bacillus sp. PK3_68]|uniref:luciferase domain-containing protein n=1 Tax=Bacillus sp. PK3_68 TaxID=2027408 RepID=UPI00115CBC32|nr:luciferase family protein [Bacillus sp. PK3_68]
MERASRLPDVTLQPTELSVPALALVMDETSTDGIEEAFIRNREFALIRTDGSIHLPLMLQWGEYVLKAGWSCIHPLVRYMAGALPPQNFIVYAPRDEQELEIVWRIVQGSYFYARGWIENVDN